MYHMSEAARMKMIGQDPIERNRDIACRNTLDSHFKDLFKAPPHGSHKFDNLGRVTNALGNPHVTCAKG
jgi:hypothetical protein